MRTASFILYGKWVVALLALASGCALMLPPARDSKREAEQKERSTCPLGKAPQYPIELLDGSSVVIVKPLYSMVRSARTGPEYRLSGATIQLRPFPALSSESLESLLNCHNARSELARAGEPIIPNDPYWVAGQDVRVSVRSESGGLRAEVRASDLETAKEILRRATAFATLTDPRY
jgi:hypothetical protein